MPHESRAYNLLKAEADALYTTGQAASIMDAMNQTAQAHPDWWEAYRREHLAAVPPAVAKQAMPLDYSQRKALATQQPLSTRSSTSAAEQLIALTTARMDATGETFLTASEVIAKAHRDLYHRAHRERRG
jgi:hypothetical protein